MDPVSVPFPAVVVGPSVVPTVVPGVNPEPDPEPDPDPEPVPGNVKIDISRIVLPGPVPEVLPLPVVGGTAAIW